MNTKIKLGKSFTFLNITQFSGALNDNIFKLLMMMFLATGLTVEQTNSVTAKVGAVFVIPFLLFLALAGKVADRFSKRNIIVGTKLAETAIMISGFLAFYLGSTAGLYITLFFMASQSAFFSPAKYGIIPELVGDDNISRANSYIEAMTYLAIVFGTAGAPFILQKMTGGSYTIAALFCVAFSLVGIVLSFPIEKTPPASKDATPSIFFLRDIWNTLREVRPSVELLEVDGKKLVFSVEAHDGIDLICRGRHDRFVVKKEKFDQRVQQKTAQ